MASFVAECIDPGTVIASPAFATVASFLRDTGWDDIGWHYATDLGWIHEVVRDLPPGALVLDAGGGTGPTQFLLAELGFHVVNVDLSLGQPHPAWVRRYRTSREVLPSHVRTGYADHLEQFAGARALQATLLRPLAWLRARRRAERLGRWRRAAFSSAAPPGTIRWKVGNLSRMPELASGAFDAVVSLSAVEHIPPDALDAAWAELRRVAKPSARWAVTTSASATDETWFHAPSQGWCFSCVDVERRFGAAWTGALTPSVALERYRRCDYLRRSLAPFYRRSGANGMPWGIWDPRYVPIGLRAHE